MSLWNKKLFNSIQKLNIEENLIYVLTRSNSQLRIILQYKLTTGNKAKFLVSKTFEWRPHCFAGALGACIFVWMCVCVCVCVCI